MTNEAIEVIGNDRKQPVPVYKLIHGMNREGLVRTRVKGFEYDASKRLNTLDGKSFNNPYIEGFDKYEELERLHPFQGDVLVDLGSGSGKRGLPTSIKIAKLGGAIGYVSVDLFKEEWCNDYDKAQGVSKIAARYMKELDIPIAVVQEDMLSFLKRLPNRSISALCSGIDRDIVENEYGVQVQEELKRTINRAILFGFESLVICPLLPKIKHLQLCPSYLLGSRKTIKVKK
tara:strand:- start:3 stop:695 length:693 start_codon:yes stop_codon:yes gene_type:complete